MLCVNLRGNYIAQKEGQKNSTDGLQLLSNYKFTNFKHFIHIIPVKDKVFTYKAGDECDGDWS